MIRLAHRRSFTLVELLIVIALIAVVSGMVVGLFGSAVEKSGATVSMATQKQLLNQVNAYMQLHGNLLPDKFDTYVTSDTTGYAYETLGTYNPIGYGSTDYNVAVDPAGFFAQPVDPTASTSPNEVNRGVHPDLYSGATRTVTVKQLTQDDVDLLNSMGVTQVFDIDDTRDLFYGDHRTNGRTLAVGDPICIVDPQSEAGIRLYQDLGIDLSDTGDFPRQGSDDSGTPWDDTFELTDAARLAALTTQTFYVLPLGRNSAMIGDGLAGVQEAPASSVVNKGIYKRFAVLLKKGAFDNGDRNAGLAGVMDPRGRGASAARAAVDSIN